MGVIDTIDLDVPQSTIRFGRPALKRDDPDYIASVVAAHVLGGSGSMTSRLFREVREKRGLAYTVFGDLLRARARNLLLRRHDHQERAGAQILRGRGG